MNDAGADGRGVSPEDERGVAFEDGRPDDDPLDGDLRSALRRLECSDPSRPRLGRAVRLSEEVVRLSQTVSLGFGGQSLVRLERVEGPRPWRLHCRYPGLFGSSGPLPLHLTEEADRRARHDRDASTREFIDLFNHRLIALFYRAWADAEPAIAGDRPDENPFADMLGALGGFIEPASRGRDAVPDALRQGSAMWFGPSARSPDGLRALLRRHLGIDARVVESSGGWTPLPEGARCALGGGGRRDRHRLGEHLLGRRGWCANGTFRLVVRVPDLEAFESLSRAGRSLDVLGDLVRTYVGDELAWELELALPATAARPVTLGSRGARLGRDAWLAPGGAPRCRLRLDEARRRRIRGEKEQGPHPADEEAPSPVDEIDAATTSVDDTTRIPPPDETPTVVNREPRP